MGVYSSSLEREVRMERMRPDQIDQAVRECPAVFLAFGSIEWHGRQNPVGLDTIKAHEELVGLASRVGGVVYPPIFLGSGGGHGEYAYSHMVKAEPMREIVADLLAGLEADGFEAAILLSGHYPNKWDYLEPAVELHRERGGAMKTLILIEWEAPDAGGDHAARWETSYELFLHPETVDLSVLGDAPDDEEATGPDEKCDWMGEEFRDHPCYGILGADPRLHASAELGRTGAESLIEHLRGWLGEAGVLADRAD